MEIRWFLLGVCVYVCGIPNRQKQEAGWRLSRAGCSSGVQLLLRFIVELRIIYLVTGLLA